MTIYIAPPFGSYFRPKRALAVLGSFTVQPRRGRTGQVLRTVRPVPGGWVNAIGLRNPGINSLPDFFAANLVVSLAPLAVTDWHDFERWADERGNRMRVEFNVSCPNIDGHPALPTKTQFQRMIIAGSGRVSVKLPPTSNSLALVQFFADAGVQRIHVSNTLPSPAGGISGRVLREANLPLVSAAADWLSTNGYRTEIIGGGGIYRIAHAHVYRGAGAAHVSLGTVWMNPLRGWMLYRRLVEAGFA